MPNLPLPVNAILQQDNLHSLLWVTQENAADSATTLYRTADAVLAADFFQRVDLVFVSADAFSLDKPMLLQLLAKSRDLLSSRVVVECPLEQCPQWQEADFLALAMRRRAVMAGATCEHVFYGYDLKTYKPAPDWLNPKYWANPHMWDKARW